MTQALSGILSLSDLLYLLLFCPSWHLGISRQVGWEWKLAYFNGWRKRGLEYMSVDSYTLDILWWVQVLNLWWIGGQALLVSSGPCSPLLLTAPTFAGAGNNSKDILSLVAFVHNLSPSTPVALTPGILSYLRILSCRQELWSRYRKAHKPY